MGFCFPYGFIILSPFLSFSRALNTQSFRCANSFFFSHLFVFSSVLCMLFRSCVVRCVVFFVIVVVVVSLVVFAFQAPIRYRTFSAHSQLKREIVFVKQVDSVELRTYVFSFVHNTTVIACEKSSIVYGVAFFVFRFPNCIDSQRERENKKSHKAVIMLMTIKSTLSLHLWTGVYFTKSTSSSRECLECERMLINCHFAHQHSLL